MSNPDDCVFCALYRGKAEVSAVFRNDRVMAAMTIQPTHVGHVLLFPSLHVEDFALLDQESLGYLFHVAGRLKAAVCAAIPCQGFQLLINQGEATRQKENCRHLHVHLIPCSSNVPVEEGALRAEVPRTQLDEIAQQIARRLDVGAAFAVR